MAFVLLETMAHIVTVITPFLPVIGAGATTLSVAGLLPRVGPGRAAWVALSSRFLPNKGPLSQRTTEVESLRELLKKKDWGQGYYVVTGSKGVGKSCFLATATKNTPGVIKVKIQPTHDADKVINLTLSKLTNVRYNWYNPAANANRVIFWHRIFTLGRSPVVVIAIAERGLSMPPPSYTGAIRSLVDDYGLRVIVDSSPNSIDDMLLQTERASVIDIIPMTKEMIWGLPQLDDLMKLLDETGLAEVAWAVLGGIPVHYEIMWLNYLKGQDKTRLEQFLINQVSSAIETISSYPKDGEKIIDLFNPKIGYILRGDVKAKGLSQPSPDKVFRKEKRSGKFVLVPSSAAISIALSYHMKKEPTMEELKKIAMKPILEKPTLEEQKKIPMKPILEKQLQE